MEPEYPKSIITLRNTPINNIEKFKYLGAFIKHDRPSTGDVELNYRIQITISKFIEMSALLQNIKINLQTCVSFFNSFIQSQLVYFCQNWNLTAAQYERIDSTYQNLLRRMIRDGFNRVGENDYWYRINSERLHSLCGTSDALIFVKKQQLNYCEHLIRMPHSRIPKTLLFNEDKYKKRGRPYKSLLEQALETGSWFIDPWQTMQQRYDEGKFVILCTWNWHESQWNSWQHRSANWSSCHYSHRGSCPNITSNSNL